MTVLGSDTYRYEEASHWAQLPSGRDLGEVVDIGVDGQDRVYIGQLQPQLPFNADYPNLGACVSIHDLAGKRLARLGASRFGEAPGQFIAPHGLAVDSRGSIYVGEVSWTAYGCLLDPPRRVKSFRKLVKI